MLQLACLLVVSVEADANVSQAPTAWVLETEEYTQLLRHCFSTPPLALGVFGSSVRPGGAAPQQQLQQRQNDFERFAHSVAPYHMERPRACLSHVRLCLASPSHAQCKNGWTIRPPSTMIESFPIRSKRMPRIVPLVICRSYGACLGLRRTFDKWCLLGQWSDLNIQAVAAVAFYLGLQLTSDKWCLLKQ